MPKYKQLSIDGVIGDIWDDAAVHNDDVIDVVLEVINAPAVRTALLNIYHPIGSFYFTKHDTNPSTFIGGEWDRVEGRFLIGACEAYPGESEGGSANAVAVAHTHSAFASVSNGGEHAHSVTGSTNVAGNHSHGMGNRWSDGSGSETAYRRDSSRKRTTIYNDANGNHSHTVTGSTSTSSAHSHPVIVAIDPAGEDGTGKNLPPYKAVYMWVRTA